MATIYKSNWVDRIVNPEKYEEKTQGWLQLELDLEELMCRHEFYDDGDNLAIACRKCGYSSEVSFSDPFDGKTYQEIFDIMGKDMNLK